jgi:anti-anti-sigma factor
MRPPTEGDVRIDPTQPASESVTDAPTVALRVRPAYPPGYAAVVDLCGEHDLASNEEIEAALALVDGDLLIDLSDCPFVDSTVIAALIRKSQELTRNGHRLDLVVPPTNAQVHRVFDIVGMSTFVTILAGLPTIAARVSAEMSTPVLRDS